MAFDFDQPIFFEVLQQRLLLAQNTASVLSMKSIRCFRPPAEVNYHPLCDDFGPMNMLSVFHFIKLLDQEFSKYPSLKIVYYIEPGSVDNRCHVFSLMSARFLSLSFIGKRAMTNAIFLVGAYLILRRDMNTVGVAEVFSWVDSKVAVPFRDASFTKPDFDLTLVDCWMGLERGKSLGWVARPTAAKPGIWGSIDERVLEHYDDPTNGDLHEIVPGSLFAFRGPVDIPGSREFLDDKEGYRVLSPNFYSKVFQKLGITTVVRLNEPCYDRRKFEAEGISHHDLPFEDCTAPPTRTVQAFLRVIESSPGAVAVHCKAGLGRTGTLIAIVMMKHHGFTAREAIAWLRIIRPGSVIGEQQHYLCAIEASRRDLIASPPSARFSTIAPAAVGRSSAWLPQRQSTAPRSTERQHPPPVELGAERPQRWREGGAVAAAVAAQVAAGLRMKDAARARHRAVKV
jgi:cell division cycle 14